LQKSRDNKHDLRSLEFPNYNFSGTEQVSISVRKEINFPAYLPAVATDYIRSPEDIKALFFRNT
jgi:hypothetical protein